LVHCVTSSVVIVFLVLKIKCTIIAVVPIGVRWFRFQEQHEFRLSHISYRFINNKNIYSWTAEIPFYFITGPKRAFNSYTISIKYIFNDIQIKTRHLHNIIQTVIFLYAYYKYIKQLHLTSCKRTNVIIYCFYRFYTPIMQKNQEYFKYS